MPLTGAHAFRDAVPGRHCPLYVRAHGLPSPICADSRGHLPRSVSDLQVREPPRRWLATRLPGYPFEPKPIARLQAAQFWVVPLPGDRHACGRVLHVAGAGDSLYLNSRTFLAGLIVAVPAPPAPSSGPCPIERKHLYTAPAARASEPVLSLPVRT
jgi:hypothetical protein